jgi:carboxypeptidase T
MLPFGALQIKPSLSWGCHLFLAGFAALVACSALQSSEKTNSPESPLVKLVEMEQAEIQSVYRVTTDDIDLARKLAISFKAQLYETSADKKTHFVRLDPEQIEELQTFGFEVEPAGDWIQARHETLERLKTPANLSPRNIDEGLTIPGFPCYETVEHTFAKAENLVAKYPDLATWIDIGDSWEKTEELGGYDLFVLKLTNSLVPGPKPILFIHSAMHAREYTTAPLVTEFAHFLTENYGSNADATWILDHHEVHLFLMMNPDGRKMAEAGLSWRKNTNQDYCAVNSGFRGADLNRNFTFGWNSAGGSSGNPCNLTYRGAFPASEPETQAIETYVRSIFEDNRGPGPDDASPDTTSGIHLDIHSYGELILWPWGDTAEPAPNFPQLQTLGRKFAFYNGYAPLQSIGLYPADGTSSGVSYGELGVPAYTFELGSAFFQNCAYYDLFILSDNIRALLYAAKVVRTPYITPSGPNTDQLTLTPAVIQSGTPVTIKAVISDLQFNNSQGNEETQVITEAEFFIETPPWSVEQEPVAYRMEPQDGAFDNRTEAVAATIDTTGWPVGRHLIYARGKDASDTWGAISAGFITVSEQTASRQYCESEGKNQFFEWISAVKIGRFSNYSGSSNYSDFTSQIWDIRKGDEISVALTPGFARIDSSMLMLNPHVYEEHWKVWIDLNHDGDFDDPEENVFSEVGANTVTGNFTIPESALSGPTRMRISMQNERDPLPCGSFPNGEVEDYTVNILNSLR